MTAFEYRRATWEEVCALGPQGWRLVAVPPIVEMRQTLGQMQAGEPLYVVEREGKPKYGAALEPGPVAKMFMPGPPRRTWPPQEEDGHEAEGGG